MANTDSEHTLTLFVTTRQGEKRAVPATVGLSVMECIRNSGIDEIEALCGGSGACCTCHVIIEPEWLSLLPPMSKHEDALLDSSDARTDGSRLACQIPVTEALDGLKLMIAPEP